MKQISIIILTFLMSMQVYSQTNDSLGFSERLNQLEIKNTVLKAKVEAYNDSNSNILNTVSITIAILLGIFGLVNITQLIQNYRMNTKKLSEIEKSVMVKVNKESENRINSIVSSKFAEIDNLNGKILELDIRTLQNRCPSINPQDINIEILNLVQLLKISITHFKFSQSNSHVNTALEGLVTHLKKHGIPHDYEKEMIFNSIKDLTSEFDFKKEKIVKLLRNK